MYLLLNESIHVSILECKGYDHWFSCNWYILKWHLLRTTNQRSLSYGLKNCITRPTKHVWNIVEESERKSESAMSCKSYLWCRVPKCQMQILCASILIQKIWSTFMFKKRNASKKCERTFLTCICTRCNKFQMTEESIPSPICFENRKSYIWLLFHLDDFSWLLWLFSHDGKVRILNFNSKCAFWIKIRKTVFLTVCTPNHITMRNLKCAFQMTVERCFPVTHLANHAAKSLYECRPLNRDLGSDLLTTAAYIQTSQHLIVKIHNTFPQNL